MPERGLQVLLPADMTVRESHDIALMLQHKARALACWARPSACSRAVVLTGFDTLLSAH